MVCKGNKYLAIIYGTSFVACTPTVNLISITQALNWKIEFFPPHCIFFELNTWRTIGNSTLQDGTYLLHDRCGLSIPVQTKLC